MRHSPLTMPRPVLCLFWSLWFGRDIDILRNDLFCLLYFCLSTHIHIWLLTTLPEDLSKCDFCSNNIKNLLKTYGHILPYFFIFPLFLSFVLHILSSITCQHFSLTSVLVESILEQYTLHLCPATVSIPDPQWHCQALCPIHCLPATQLCSHLDYQSHNSG